MSKPNGGFERSLAQEKFGCEGLPFATRRMIAGLVTSGWAKKSEVKISGKL
jgi:hypothetical protein